MHPWQQIGLEDEASVRAMNSYRQGSPVFRLTHQGSVPLTPSDPIVYAKDLATLCSPSTPMVWQILIRSTNGQLRHVLVRPCPVVGASRRCTCAVGPISRLCIVYWPDFSHPVHPVHPKWSAFQGAQVLLGNIPWRYVHHRALSRRDHLPINALSSVRPVDVHVLSVHPVVCAFGNNNPRSCWFSLLSVSWR